jgi:hypothetical protein
MTHVDIISTLLFDFCAMNIFASITFIICKKNAQISLLMQNTSWYDVCAHTSSNVAFKFVDTCYVSLFEDFFIFFFNMILITNETINTSFVLQNSMKGHQGFDQYFTCLIGFK